MRRIVNVETGEEGELEGIRLPLFNYTSKKILTMHKYNEYVPKEICQVKTMKNPQNAGWIMKPQRNHSIIHETDCVGHLSGVGKEAKKKLTEAGITQVFQLAAIGNDKKEKKDSIKKSQMKPNSLSPSSKSFTFRHWTQNTASFQRG